jgi:BioD-like phosphotransacetylase family protein
VVSSPKRLLVGSTEPYSGKSATLLGIGLQMQAIGIDVAFGKPVGYSPGDSTIDPDLDFIVTTLHLPESRFYPPALSLSQKAIEHLLASERNGNSHSLQSFTQSRGKPCYY